MKSLPASQFPDKVLSASHSHPVLVDFSATWCGPCRTLAPILTKVAEEYVDKATFYKIDIDKNVALTEEHKVMSVPTMLLFVGGKPVGRITGLASAARIKKLLDKHLPPSPEPEPTPEAA